MSRILGVIAIILGSLGVVVLVAGGVAVWRVESQVVERTDRASARVSERLQTVEGRLERLEDKVQTIRLNVDGIRAAAKEHVEKAIKNAVTRAEVNLLLERLNGLLVRSEELGMTLNLVADLIEDMAELGADFEVNPQRMEQLKTVATTLDHAATELTTLRTELSTFHLDEVAADPEKLFDFAGRSRVPLERLAGGIANVRDHSAAAREEVGQLRDKICFWTRTVALVLSLLFLWFGLGQLCLIGWGWRKMKATTSGG